MIVLGYSNFTNPPNLIQSISIPKSSDFHLSNITLKKPNKNPKLKFSTLSNKNGVQQERGGIDDDDDELKKDRSPVLNLKWGDLLNPDPDNLFAVALTGLLSWASVQVLGQLVFISLAILVAALKYSFIAALLVFILIALL